MSIHFSSDSDDDRMRTGKAFGRERPIYDVLGGGRVAEVLLWRDKTVSAIILAAVSILWFLFEVAEYNFVTLLSQIIITAMLVIFIWSMAADFFKWTPPRIPEIILHESSSREIAAILHSKFNLILMNFFDIASGYDFRQFILGIVSLYIISVIGNYVSTLNLLFFGCLCLQTLPFLYERYEEHVDYHVVRASHQMKKSFKKFDSEFLRKIPRGPVKEKKAK